MTADVSHLMDTAEILIAKNRAEAAARAMREVFTPLHPRERCRRLRRESLQFLAQSADLRAQITGGRASEELIARQRVDLNNRVLEYIGEVRRCVAADGLEPGAGARLKPALERAERESAETEDEPSPALKNAVFLSYRRDDSNSVIVHIFEHFEGKLGNGTVFMDVDSIPLGVDYRPYIASRLAMCKACLAVIGPKWLDAKVKGGGARRLDQPSDLVRVELETAMALNKAVIPLLVLGAEMPEVSALPETLRGLSERNGFRVRDALDFATDMDRLVERVIEVF